MIQLSKISSTLIAATGYGGTRDYAVDMSVYLETDEEITIAYVVSASPAVLVISNVAYSGQDVTFSAKVAGGPITEVIGIDVAVIGDGGSADTWESEVLIVPKLPN